MLKELIFMNLCVKHQEYFQIMFLEQGQISGQNLKMPLKPLQIWLKAEISVWSESYPEV